MFVPFRIFIYLGCLFVQAETCRFDAYENQTRKILLLCMQVLLPVVPGLLDRAVQARNGGAFAAHAGHLDAVPQPALHLIWYWRLGWSRSERLDAALLLVLFCFFPLPGHWLLDGMLDGSLTSDHSAMMQAGFYVASMLAPLVGRFQQRHTRLLSGREKFESRKEVMKAREA